MNTEEMMEGTMARPERRDVDYFPFYVKRGKTLNILQSKFGLEGIGFFTNLMRFLALTPDHHYCIKDEIDRMNFFAEIGIQDESRGLEMIELMVKTEKLDKGLWEDHMVIACEAFLKSIEDAYKNRVNQIITIDGIRAVFEKEECGDNRMTIREAAEVLGVSGETIKNRVRELYPDLMRSGLTTYLNEKQITAIKQKIGLTEVVDAEAEFVGSFVGADKNDPSVCSFPVEETDKNTEETYKNPSVCSFPVKILGNNPQTKLKKTKLKDSKVNSEAAPPAFPENPLPSKPEKTKKPPLREREPINDMERVEKAYLLNWDSLYAQGKVKAINPVVNWNQTRKLLKTHFESLDVELIIQAVNNALNDEWVLNAGYSLGMMLSASVLNRLINGNGSGPPKHRIAADNVSQEKVSSYFREAK
jgi:DNA-binding Lrp family transcriptional regulator